MLDKRKLFVVICVLSSTWASTKPILNEPKPKTEEILITSNPTRNEVEANVVPAQLDAKALVPVEVQIPFSQNPENNVVTDALVSSDKTKISEEDTRWGRPHKDRHNTTKSNILANATETPSSQKPDKPNEKPNSETIKPGKPNGEPNSEHEKPDKPNGRPNVQHEKPDHTAKPNTNSVNKPNGKSNTQSGNKPNNPNSVSTSQPSTVSANIPAADIQETEPQISHVSSNDQEQLSAAKPGNDHTNENANVNSEYVDLQQNPIPATSGKLPTPNKANEMNDDSNKVIINEYVGAEVTVTSIKPPVVLWGLPLINVDVFKPKDSALTENNEDKENSSEAERIAASKIEAQMQQIKYQVIQALNSSTNGLLANEKTSVTPEHTSDKFNMQGSLTEEQVKSILSANHTEAIKLSLQQNFSSAQSQMQSGSPRPTKLNFSKFPQNANPNQESNKNKNEVSSSTEQLGVQESSITVPVENLSQPELYYEVEEMIDEPAGSFVNANSNISLQPAENILSQILSGGSSQFAVSGISGATSSHMPAGSSVGASSEIVASGIGTGAASSHIPAGNSGGSSSEFAVPGIGAGGAMFQPPGSGNAAEAASQPPSSGNFGGGSAQQPGQAVLTLGTIISQMIFGMMQGSSGQHQPQSTLGNNVNNIDPNMQAQMQQQISNLVVSLLSQMQSNMLTQSQSRPIFMSHASGADPVSSPNSVAQSALLSSGEIHNGLSAASVVGSSQDSGKPEKPNSHANEQSSDAKADKPSKPQNAHESQQNSENSLAQQTTTMDKAQNPPRPQHSQVQENSQSVLTHSEENGIKDNAVKPSSALTSQLQEDLQHLILASEENTILAKPETLSRPVNSSILENTQSLQENLQNGNHQQMSSQTILATQAANGPQISKADDTPGKGKHPSSNTVTIEEETKAENTSQNGTHIKNVQEETGKTQEWNSVIVVAAEESENANRVTPNGNKDEVKPTDGAEKSPVITKPESISKPAKPVSNKKPKPKPVQGKPSAPTASKPKPQFGFGFSQRKPPNKEGVVNESTNGAVSAPPKPNPSGWHLPKWPSFAQLYKNIFGVRQRADGEQFEEILEESCVPPTVNLRDKQDDRPLCGALPTKDGVTCEKLCRESGFNVGTCLEDNSCICSYSESSEAGLRMEYYYERNFTNWEEYYPSYDSCSRCSCSNLCTETGYFLGVCGNTCYCARPFYNGIPLELFTNPEQKSQ